MELPIQLSFFKKLDAYQALLEQNRKAKNKARRTKPWEKEKDFLAWAAQNHHHLDHPISLHTFKTKLVRTGKYNGGEEGFLEALGNLKVRGFAMPDVTTQSIKLTKEGLIMGQVIVDTEVKGGYHRWKYPFWLLIGWLAIAAAVVILFSNAYDALPYLPSIEELLNHIFSTSAPRRQVIIGVASLFAAVAGHFIVSPVVRRLREGTFSDDQLKQIQLPSQLLGIVERFMYVIAWFMGQAQFIGLWLGLKAIGEWSHYQMNKSNIKDSGRGQYTVFLIGAALSLMVAFIFIWLAEKLI